MLYKLLEQYKKINGLEKLTAEEIKSEKFRKDFLLWLYKRQQYGYRYIDFLYEMNNKILNRTTAEIGKSEFDSIVIPFDTTIISPSEFYELEDRERIIQSKFIVIDEKPILYFDKSDSPRMLVLPERKIDTFMTQNPYYPYSISNWEGLHNSGKFNIAVGVYGNIHDKNIKDNLNILKQLREKIIGDDYKFDYKTSGDIYYAAIASTRKIKTLGSKSR